MKAVIMAFCEGEPNLRAERLSSQDWDNLVDIHGFLAPFYHLTLGTEGIADAIDRVLPGFDFFWSISSTNEDAALMIIL